MQNKIKNLIKKLSKFGYNVRSKNSRRVDPVCGMEATSDLFKVAYEGQDYFFCSVHCKGEFEAKPEDYTHKS